MYINVHSLSTKIEWFCKMSILTSLDLLPNSTVVLIVVLNSAHNRTCLECNVEMTNN